MKSFQEKTFLENNDNVLLDQTIRFTGNRNKGNYPSELRRIVYFAPELKRSFVYYTNNFSPLKLVKLLFYIRIDGK